MDTIDTMNAAERFITKCTTHMFMQETVKGNGPSKEIAQKKIKCARGVDRNDEFARTRKNRKKRKKKETDQMMFSIDDGPNDADSTQDGQTHA